MASLFWGLSWYTEAHQWLWACQYSHIYCLIDRVAVSAAQVMKVACSRLGGELPGLAWLLIGCFRLPQGDVLLPADERQPLRSFNPVVFSRQPVAPRGTLRLPFIKKKEISFQLVLRMYIHLYNKKQSNKIRFAIAMRCPQHKNRVWFLKLFCVRQWILRLLAGIPEFLVFWLGLPSGYFI